MRHFFFLGGRGTAIRWFGRQPGFLLPGLAILCGSLRVIVASLTAQLITSASPAHANPARFPGAAIPAIDMAPVAMAADHNLATAARA